MDGSNSASSDLSLAPSGRMAGRHLLRRTVESPQFGLLLMAATIALLVVWAALAKVDRVVRVEGHIIPAGRSQTIQHLEGGIVAAIGTREGVQVRKGDVLVVIDDTSVEANLTDTKAKLAAERIKAARLKAEADGLDAVSIPSDLQHYQALVDSELQLFRVRRQKLDAERRVLDEQSRQRTAEIREIEERRVRLNGEMTTARKRFDMLSAMAAKSAASSLEVLEAQSRQQRLSTEIGDAEASLPKLHAALAELDARVQDSKARFRADAQAELTSVLVEIGRLQQLLTTESDRFRRTEVRAPVDGIVNKVNLTTVGGVVKPGDTIIEITPLTDKVLIEARARPSDRGELRVGLPAKIRISAYDVAELGPLMGEVEEVSADTVADPRGEPYYRVAILVGHLDSAYAGRQIVPGMTVSGDVIIGRRTILRYLTSPFMKFTYNAFRDAR